MARVFRQISSVALATVFSRVLGLLRDILIFAVLGTGAVNSAFVLAFTLPNLFRRLLGEGALTSAFIPVLSGTIEEQGRERGFALLNRLFTRLIIILTVLSAGVVGTLLVVRATGILEGRWALGADLSVLLFPYVIFICLAAVLAAVLNVLGRFFVPAFTPVLLNLAMIAGLGAGFFLGGENPMGRVWWLCAGVMLGGFMQLAAPWRELRKENWRGRWDRTRNAETAEVWRLFLPGVVGAAIFQGNIVVSRFLAFGLNETAAGILYLANRLVELPLGVFAISITTVFFPALTKDAARGEPSAFFRTYDQGLRLIFAITLPAAIGLAVLAEPILRALFEWGLFASADVERTVWPLRIFALGLPLYAWSTLATRGLHSWKEMKLPVRIGAVNAVLNLAFSLILLGPLGEVGLALANVLAALAFAALLERGVRKRESPGRSRRELWREGAKMLLAAAVMGGVAAGLATVIPRLGDLSPKVTAAFIVGIGVPLGVVTYGGLLVLMRATELEAFRALWRKRRSKARSGR